MRRRNSGFSILELVIALAIVMLVLAVSNAWQQIGRPTRWVGVLTILAFAFGGGAFFARAIMKRRVTK